MYTLNKYIWGKYIPYFHHIYEIRIIMYNNQLKSIQEQKYQIFMITYIQNYYLSIPEKDTFFLFEKFFTNSYH